MNKLKSNLSLSAHAKSVNILLNLYNKNHSLEIQSYSSLAQYYYSTTSKSIKCINKFYGF